MNLREEIRKQIMLDPEYTESGAGTRIMVTEALEVRIEKLCKQWALEMVGEDESIPQQSIVTQSDVTSLVISNRNLVKQEIRERINNEKD